MLKKQLATQKQNKAKNKTKQNKTIKKKTSNKPCFFKISFEIINSLIESI